MMLRKSTHSIVLSTALCLQLIGSLGSQTFIPANADTKKAFKAFDRKDYKTAFQEFLESAQKGDAEAQAGVGSMLMMKMNPPGTGVYADSEEWLKRSANQGNTQGMTWLAKFYYNSAQHSKQSLSTPNVIAGTGRVSSMAYNNRPPLNPSMSSGALSSFFGGRGRIPQQSGSANAPWVPTPPSPTRFSMPVPHSSATVDSPKSQEHYSQEASFQKARYWFQKSAKRGDAYAMEKLAIMMDSGMGGPRDPKEAALWRTRMQQKKDKHYTPNAINYPIEP